MRVAPKEIANQNGENKKGMGRGSIRFKVRMRRRAQRPWRFEAEPRDNAMKMKDSVESGLNSWIKRA